MAAHEVAIRRTNPQQKQLMRTMPPVFGLFLAFSGFPSGLFVYFTSNAITLYRNTPSKVPSIEPQAQTPDPPEKETVATTPTRRKRGKKKSKRR